MSEMIKRVARAMCVADGENPDAFHTMADYASGCALPDHAFPLWFGYRAKATAAFAELKTPTLPMINAMTKRLGEGWDSITTATDIWQVGVDEALKP